MLTHADVCMYGYWTAKLKYSSISWLAVISIYWQWLSCRPDHCATPSVLIGDD
jgi:hypothetical protein